MSTVVSICIPAYKQPEKLEKCLDSIFRQTYSQYEIIIADDTPGDSVSELVKPYLARGDVKYIHNSCTKGTPENWNTAMREASGEYIMVMHHDDWFYTDMTLEKLVQSIKEHPVDLVFAQSYNINADIQIISRNHPDPPKIRKLNADIRCLFYHNWIGAPSAVLFKNRGVYFDPRLKWLVDIEFYIRYIKNGRVYFNPEAIVGIGISPTQVTRSCYGNRDVEVGENLLVYGTLKHTLRYFISDFSHFHRLFSRFDIKEIGIFKLTPVLRIRFLYLLSSILLSIKGTIRSFLR